MKNYLLVFILLLGHTTYAQSELDWWNDAVFYEVFVRSFYDSDGDGVGDFKGLTEKLDYLNDGDPNTDTDLGITGIWLMPINPSPSYHGYDVTDYRGINPDYGTMEDFKAFLAAAHERGIKVIIDYVMNHSSAQHEWFVDAKSSASAEKRDWYRWEDTKPNYSGPWGQNVWHNSSTGYYYGIFWDQMPDLNYENPDLKAAMFDHAAFWIDDIGIDGFRLDAVKYIYESGSQLEDLEATHTFFKDLSAHIKSFNPDAITVGEAWTSTSKVVPYVIDERIDFCFEFDLATSIINAARSGSITNLTDQITNVIDAYPWYQFSTFLTNHDQNRIMNELSSDMEKAKIAASIYLTLPGVPFLYYGEEVGMLGAKPDENIRRPMQWTGGRNAGFTTASSAWNAPSSNYSDNNVDELEDEPSSLLNHYKKLIHTRNDYAALRTGDFVALNASLGGVLTYLRQSGDEKVVVAINTSASNKRFDIDFSSYADAADHPPYDHLSGESLLSVASSSGDLEGLFLSPYQTMVLTFDREATVLSASSFSQVQVFPNPASDIIRINTGTQNPVHYELVALNGAVIQSGVFKKEISVAELNEGLYVLKLSIDGGTQQQKIMVTH
ncbi:MAG: alpha-amylase family glycosyl hydrolase [Marinoscillum sp.]|uniref:alpha-amylase family glycosyl hydrolase n=1 Tax=Marinoscillum sp. TaxID=2024838 RepID=UPI0032FEDEAC